MDKVSSEHRSRVVEAVRQADEAFRAHVVAENAIRCEGMKTPVRGSTVQFPLTLEEMEDALTTHRFKLLLEVASTLGAFGGLEGLRSRL